VDARPVFFKGVEVALEEIWKVEENIKLLFLIF
jgi:hypothetical protein